MSPDIIKTLNLKVSAETHRRLRILAASTDQTAGEIVTELVNREWTAKAGDLAKGGKP